MKSNNTTPEIPIDYLLEGELPEELMFEHLTTEESQYGENNYPNKFIEKLKETGANSFSIMPAGMAGRTVFNFLKETTTFNIINFIDNNLDKKPIYGKGVISVKDFKSLNSSSILIIAVQSQETQQQIAEQLRSADINYITFDVDLYLEYSANTSLWSKTEYSHPQEIIHKNISKLNKVYQTLYDKQSKRVLLAILNYRLSFCKKWLTHVVSPSEKQYFEPSIYQFHAYDHFVDCGVFVGDTLLQLMKITDGKIQNYYGFEPSPYLFDMATEAAGKQKAITLFSIGTFSTKKKLSFNCDNMPGSHCIDKKNGSHEINVDAIDNILGDKKVTFIKMDIEGAEIESLKGAQNIIQKQYPVLAISVYHKFDDLWEIPLLIKSYAVDYKYYLRHYTLNTSETVLYCIPK